MKRLLVVCVVGVLLWPQAAVFGETDAERRARLEKELQVVEKQIIQQQSLLEGKQVERQSLERDLNILDTQINKAALGIEARELAIEQLTDQIGEKEEVIDILTERLQKQRQSIAELVRKTQVVDDYSLVELMLSNQNLSEFFVDFENYRVINDSLNESLEALSTIKSDTESQKTSLEDKKLTEAELKELQEQEKLAIERKENEKEQILDVTKGEEAAYKQLLQAQQKTAAEIRAQLFELAGGGGKIPFPDAVQYAKAASAQTGVPAALVLAILEQESSYGANIGSCAYDDIVYGRAVMHPDRDQPVFVAIANALGFNPSTQQVSCPWIRNGERIGWGGAMGPSQFIPSTWAIYGGIVSTGSGYAYSASSDAIRQLTGKSSPSNPFNNQDAFMATALLMRDNGAAGGTYNAQWTAAIRYFAGWGGASNPINHPYGDNVMARKARLEQEIKTLEGS
ncbi:lytic murein transglycosylase [Candidatus Nomurabacteria bacterium]|nr:lytic murein transglycosylase [Candidatus Nomurabacteria bacterium]